MGNRSKRVLIGKLLKGRGIGRLYYGPKFVAYRALSNYALKELIHKLQFKPGDIVNDCDGLNHRIVKFAGHYYYDNVLSLEQAEFDDGRWSCGCPWSPEPAWTRERIEAYVLDYTKNGPPSYITDRDHKRREAIESGKHICDENGFLLEEFK